jgi:acetylornithine deacetylase/succinyl-diaminopimelate desuccinylase-like protein
MDELAGETTELLQALIRNACVNDGTVTSGQEARNADLLGTMLEGPGIDLRSFEAQPGRTSLVARIEGRDPSAPTLLLMGHTDVVPANPEGWRQDPYGGDLIDGWVWGRGAVDMLNLTATMAVATRRLAANGWRPSGTLVYLAVADEEGGGHHGAEWLLDHAPDSVKADYVITESGGIPTATPAGLRLNLTAAEKGLAGCRLRIRGTPGHGSRPLRTDNAVVKAAEVVRRITGYRPVSQVGEIWRRYAEGMGLPPELYDVERVWDACEELEDVRLARLAHACTHTTFSTNVIMGGSKINVIPDVVDIELDCRTLPGQTSDDVRAMLAEALGPMAAEVEITFVLENPSTSSDTDTPLWPVLERVAGSVYPGAGLLPMLSTGATDARFFRRRGTPAYGFGLMSRDLTLQEFSAMFHGNDERVDVESLRLSTLLWDEVARQFLA